MSPSICARLLLVGVLAALAYPPGRLTGEDKTSEETPGGLAVAVALEQVLTQVIAEAEPSVVPIAIFSGRGSRRIGSHRRSTGISGGRSRECSPS